MQNIDFRPSEFDAFVESLADLREDRVSVLNPNRVQAMQFSYAAIQKVLLESGCDAKVTCRQSELAPDVGVVEVEGKEIDLKNLAWFCRAAEFADATEVYPLTNGKVRMAFGFNRLLNSQTIES